MHLAYTYTVNTHTVLVYCIRTLEIYQNVFEFDVAMHEALAVQKPDAVHNVERYLQPTSRIQVTSYFRRRKGYIVLYSSDKCINTKIGKTQRTRGHPVELRAQNQISQSPEPEPVLPLFH